MFYIAVVKGKEIKFPEHYEEKIGFDRRAEGLKTQAILEGEGWGLYGGEEPYECFLVRQSTQSNEGETPEDFQIRLDSLVQSASGTTTSVLTSTMIDDRRTEPELDNP